MQASGCRAHHGRQLADETLPLGQTTPPGFTLGRPQGTRAGKFAASSGFVVKTQEGSIPLGGQNLLLVVNDMETAPGDK